MLKDKPTLTRRGFVKAAGAFSAAAALYGCEKNDNNTVYGGGIDTEPDLKPPVIDETVMFGSVPHNCGGSCIIKAYVKNGAITRFTTDELPEMSLLSPTPGDSVEERACPRCRSQKSWIYSSNRLCYPLLQTGERGDINTFKRVSWAEAAAYYKAKVEKIRTNWGPAAFYKLYGTGAGGVMGPSNMLTYAGAGQFATRQDYSFPSWAHTLSIMSDFGYPPDANSFQDAVNSDVLLIWSHNLAETFWIPQISWYLKQIQELGVKVMIVDQRYSQTAVVACDTFISPVQGTDTALMMAIMHEILTTYRAQLTALYGVSTDTDLRQAVGKYLYGFFDTTELDGDATNDSYISKFPVDPTYSAKFKAAYKVGAGMSLSAYIMGGSVTDPCNLGSSIYPDEIGYNARSYTIEGVADPLYGTKTLAYGQVEKTPEWAEGITGVPAAQIQSMALMLLTKDVTIWGGGGFQRNSEGEQAVWAWEVLSNLTLAFGKPGRTHGWALNKGSAPALARSWSSAVSPATYNALVPDSFIYNAATNPEGYLSPDKSQGVFSGRLGDASKLTIANNNSKYGLTSIPVFTWLDAVEATNSDKIIEDGKEVNPSRWNVGQIKMLPAPIKMLYQEMGNILINQNGDSNHAVRVLQSKNADLIDNTAIQGVPNVTMNPLGHKVEFVCVMDCVMTPSARFADLILPGSMGFERYQTQNQFWRGGDKLILTQATVTPPGDALWEAEIGAKIADAFGEQANYYNGYAPTTSASFGEQVFTKKFSQNPGGNTFDWWKKNGMYKDVANLKDVPNVIVLEKFLESPGSAAPTDSYVDSGGTTTRRTTSGRTEAYCLAMIENYEARLYNNIDTSVNLHNGGVINTAGTPAGDPNESKGRFVYPIPMYIPIVEGRHADGSHPDPLGINQAYPLSFHTWHIMYRSHSTFNSAPLLNELKYYKRDSDGNPAYISRSITNAGAGEDNSPTDTDQNAPQVWQSNVYETVWMNPATAASYSVSEGDLIYAESLRGIIQVSVHISNRVRPMTVMIGQGSWYNPTTVNGKTVDVGGNANTLMSLLPSRIGQGMTLANDCRIKIYKEMV